jgi:hypothetical protein
MTNGDKKMFLAFTGAARAGFTLIIPFTSSRQGALQYVPLMRKVSLSISPADSHTSQLLILTSPQLPHINLDSLL